MKTYITLFISTCLLLGQLQAQAQIPSYVPTTGIVGWWPFNGNANDESGNGNNGVVYASTVLTTDRYNVLSKAYLFNGTTQSAIINSLQLTNTTTGLAASVWFNSNIALNTSAGHRMFISGTNNIPYQFAYNNGGIDLELYNSSGALTVYTIPITFLANTWNHVVFSTNTNSSILIYINGVMYNAGNAPSSFRSTSNSKYMFGLSSSAFWPVPFNGKLDDIGIWNRALTQQEVNELYTSSDPFDVSATTTTICAGQPTTLSVQSLPGTISSLTCASATNNGNLTAGVAASGVSTVVPYSGGNGGLHNGQTVSSTGITGLTATLTAGTFASGSGSLTYTITGTPSTNGTASFALSIGGQTCTLNTTVNSVQPGYPAGSVFCNGATIVNDVISSATGKIWMDRNLGASQAATSSSDANSFGDLYQWGRRSDGHQCRNSATTSTLSSVDQPAHGNFITNGTDPKDWRNPQNTNLWQGWNGVNNPCPLGYRLPTQTELSNENILNPNQSMLSEIKAPQGGYRSNSGGLTSVATWGFYWTNTLSGTLSKYLKIGGGPGFYDFSRATGASVRCIKETVGSIGALNCGSATISGNLISGSAASSVSASVPYTGGNGGFYAAQSVSSTGVTGLTASIAQGLFTSSTGSLVYTITGTPSARGTANFALNIGGKSCTLTIIVYGVQPAYPAGAVFCNGATLVSDVTNPTTGKTWMDRNLGASQAAISVTDANSYGDLYQWGRGIDGHQCRNSTTSTTLSPSDQPGINRFIINSTNPSDWRNPQNTNLWQGINGINNPCPNGYRVPTSTEIDAERLSWSGNTAAGAFASPLKLPMAGDRLGSNGQLYDVGTGGVYWSSTVSTTNSNHIGFGASTAGVYSTFRTSGYSIRCIKETVGSIGALNCGSSTVTGNLISGSAASGVSASVPYTGGNGGYYAAQSVSSSGVTGLTATISQGLFASGSGNLVYTISGTPSVDGTASFAISIGGQSCTLSIATLGSYYPVGSVFCASGPTVIKDVTSPTTGKTWMDRNLGASQVATSSSDANAYGDLYQWGRRSDGHQCRNSATTATLSSTSQPSHGSFILTTVGQTTPPYGDWLSPQNTNLWQGVSGVNNPCPLGYRLPTDIEWNSEILSWSSQNISGAFTATIKIPSSGGRNITVGGINGVGTGISYWSSTVSSFVSKALSGGSDFANINSPSRASGNSVRCIKN